MLGVFGFLRGFGRGFVWVYEEVGRRDLFGVRVSRVIVGVDLVVYVYQDLNYDVIGF